MVYEVAMKHGEDFPSWGLPIPLPVLLSLPVPLMCSGWE